MTSGFDEDMPASSPEELARLAGVIDAWAQRQIDEPWVAHVERGEGEVEGASRLE